MCGIVGRNVQTYGVFHEHSYHACISSAANHLPRARRSARHGGSKIRTLTRNVSSRSSVDRHADGQSALDNSWICGDRFMQSRRASRDNVQRGRCEAYNLLGESTETRSCMYCQHCTLLKETKSILQPELLYEVNYLLTV